MSALHRKKEPPSPPHILDYQRSELGPVLAGLDAAGGAAPAAAYRGGQILKWVFARRAASFPEMTDLPAPLREALAAKLVLRKLQVSKLDKSRRDGTVKVTYRSGDRKFFSAVFLPRKGYNSLCISSQVGCAFACGFCASGLVPFQRNLTSGEILDQVFLAESELGEKVKNVLFMGMGEPLANYAETVKAARWLTEREGWGMNPSRVVISTTGLAPQIRRLADEKLRTSLALSLHAADDALRRKIMPRSCRFPLLEILDACKAYQRKSGAELTMEYILLAGVNDRLKDARALSDLLEAVRFSAPPKVNLIPQNPVPGVPYRASARADAEAFFRFLKSRRWVVHTRKPQGQDLAAACGQLL